MSSTANASRAPSGVVLLADPAVRSIRLVEDGSRLVDLRSVGVAVAPDPPLLPFSDNDAGRMPPGSVRAPADVGAGWVHTQVRETLAERLATADASLPSGIRLLVVEGLRLSAAQEAIHAGYRERLRAEHPWLDSDEIDSLTSRFVSPPAIAPHVSGAAVDLTLIGPDGPLDLGTDIDATPEESEGACYFDAPGIPAEARHHRVILADALEEVGLVNYPTEWWHWSFGDRYWAHVTQSPFAIHGPINQQS